MSTQLFCADSQDTARGTSPADQPPVDSADRPVVTAGRSRHLPAPARSPAGTVITIVLLSLVYLVAGKIGLSLAFVNTSASAVWPPTGIALAAILVFGYRIWPGIFLGAFLVNVTTAGSLLTCIGIATGNTGEALVGGWLVNRFANGRRAFDRPQDVFGYAVLAGVLSTAVSATVGVTCLLLGGNATWTSAGDVWLTWWLGDAAGALIIGSLLILWTVESRPVPGLARWPEQLSFLLVMLAASLWLFAGRTTVSLEAYPLDFLCVPLLLWPAVRFGPREAAASAVLLSAVAIWGTMHGHGPFAHGTPNTSLLILQGFSAAITVPTIALASAIRGRARAEAALRDAHGHLEVKVATRTAQLAKSNMDLRLEADERKRAEQHFRLIVEYAPDAMVLADSAGKIRLVNSLAERMFGYGRAELDGQSIEVLLPERFRAAHRKHRKNYLLDPHVRPMGPGMELFGRRKDGSEFPVEISLSPLPTDNGSLVSAAVRDVTERRQHEEEARRHRAELTHVARLATMGEMAAALAHELNQPLCAIANQAQLASRWLTEEAPRIGDVGAIVGSIREDAARAGTIVENVRNFARKGDTQRAAHDLNGLIRRVAHIAEADARMHRCCLRFDLAENLPPVLVDALQIQQVVLNLIRNGFEAMETQDLQERDLSVTTGDGGDGHILISVSDRGAGLSQEHIDRLFEPFFTTKPNGLGMGLAISKSIAEAHGGRLWCTPNGDKGTTFHFAIPVATVPTDGRASVPNGRA